MEVIGQTIDDAAGEAFDKCAKVMGLGYPGGPIVNRLANEGNPKAFTFSKPHIPGYNYSFSGLKTSFLYTLRDELQKDPDFIEKNKKDLCASLQATVIDILMHKLRMAAKDLNIKEVAVAGGVSANSGLRDAFLDHAKRYGWKVHIPKFSFTTDNAAMVAITGYYKYMDKEFCPMDAAPFQEYKYDCRRISHIASETSTLNGNSRELYWWENCSQDNEPGWKLCLFQGGIVSYCNEVKQQVLGVSSADLEKFGAVSRPVVEQMALGAIRVLNCDCAVATSGIAGPGGAVPGKPVGTVWIAAAYKIR